MIGRIAIVIGQEADIPPPGQTQSSRCGRDSPVVMAFTKVHQTGLAVIMLPDKLFNFGEYFSGWMVGNDDVFEITIMKVCHGLETVLQALHAIVNRGDDAHRRNERIAEILLYAITRRNFFSAIRLVEPDGLLCSRPAKTVKLA